MIQIYHAIPRRFADGSARSRLEGIETFDPQVPLYNGEAHPPARGMGLRAMDRTASCRCRILAQKGSKPATDSSDRSALRRFARIRGQGGESRDRSRDAVRS